jgi:hypothetical protein
VDQPSRMDTRPDGVNTITISLSKDNSTSVAASTSTTARALLVAPPLTSVERTTATIATATNGVSSTNNGNNNINNDASRRRSAPPPIGRLTPTTNTTVKPQKEYTDFMGHHHLSVPSRRRDLLIVIGCALDTVFTAPVRKNDRLPADPKAITAFHSVSIPSMSIQTYFKRLTDYIDCSAECCVLAMVHINRIHTTKSQLPIDSLTIHRLLLTRYGIHPTFFTYSP